MTSRSLTLATYTTVGPVPKILFNAFSNHPVFTDIKKLLNRDK